MLLYYLGQENSLAKADQAGVVEVSSIGLSDWAVFGDRQQCNGDSYLERPLIRVRSEEDPEPENGIYNGKDYGYDQVWHSSID